MEAVQYANNNQWVTEEIKEETKKYTWRQMKMETQ